MFKYMVGTGILGFPLALHDLGIVGFLALCLFFFRFSWFANYQISYALDIAGRTDLNIAELGDRACGRFGLFFAVFLVVFEAWGGAMAYIKATAGIIQPMLQEPSVLGNHTVTHEWVLI
eukprot:gene17762-12610_t